MQCVSLDITNIMSNKIKTSMYISPLRGALTYCKLYFIPKIGNICENCMDYLQEFSKLSNIDLSRSFNPPNLT